MRNIIFLICILLYPNNIQASLLDDLKKTGSGLLKTANIEVAVKGKKLKNYFSNSQLLLDFEGETKEYKFQEKKYQVFQDGNLIESGKWKVSGLLKNLIKLKENDGSKTYFFKKIDKKEILYHFDKVPGREGGTKTLVIIKPLTEIAKTKREEVIAETKREEVIAETKREEIKVIKKKEETEVEKPKIVKKKKEPKIVKKKLKKDSKTKKKYRYIELTKNQIKKLKKYEERSKKIRIINSENNSIQTTKGGDTQAAQYLAAEHCAKSGFFAYSFKDSGFGEWYEAPFKRAKYFYCTDQLIFVNPFTNKEVTWTNYEKKKYFKFPNEHLFLYRNLTSSYKKLLEKKKKKNPKMFKSKPFKITYKDENSIHINGFPMGDLNRERYLANEHCSKFNKRYYYFEDSMLQGTFGSMLFHCSDKHLVSNPLSGLPLQFVSGSENYSPAASGQGSLNASQMLKYNSTNKTTFQFFEASDNLMKSLELLYRAYDQNVEADKLKAQISYNRESKYSEQDKLASTRTIIDISSKEINTQIVDASKILSDVGRGYYEQSLPYAYNAAQNSYTLIMTIKNTFEKGTQNSDSFLEYANEFIGFFAIAKDLPKLASDIFTTSKLVFSGAKSKKIRDKGNLSKALDELDLSA